MVSNQYLGAALIIVLSFAAAAIIDFVVVRICKSMTQKTATRVDDSLINLIHQPVRVSVFFFGLWVATARLHLPPVPESIIAAALKTIVVFVWTIFAMRLIRVVLRQLAKGDSPIVDQRTRPLFDNLARIVFFAGAVYFVFVFWGINVSAWLASAGVIGIAIGFAAKDSLANLISGIFILADAPYKVGDYINLDSGERGQVSHIGLRSTRLLTRDDVEVTIPNALIANGKIVNESGGPSKIQRIRVSVSVAYGTDVDKFCDILHEIGQDHPDTLKDPEPRSRFRQFGDSSLDFDLLCWIRTPELRGRVIHELNMIIYKRLAAEGIEIPYPKRDVYIKQMPSAGKS